MAQKYYNTAETAKILGKTVDDIKQMLEHRELHGYRDGADWKFKVEDIDRIAKESSSPKSDEEDDGDVLLSEVELGHSDPGLSGTVIGLNAGARFATDSDLRMAESNFALNALSGDSNPPVLKKKFDSEATSTKFEELGLSLDDDLSLDSSSVGIGGKSSGGNSTIDLGADAMDDDELVLSGSGVGSDVSIGGDSGISLIDPSDSGFSLETPVNLGSVAEESLELGEDDMLLVGEAPAKGGKVKPDDDFLLTPLEENADSLGPESTSQVIALDNGDSNETLGASSGVSMAAMLDEDLSSQPLDLGMGSPLGGPSPLGSQPGAMADSAALIQPASALAEPPYTGLQIAGLATCTVVLMLCGMLMYDLLRSMWAWEQPTAISSELMNTILRWVGL